MEELSCVQSSYSVSNWEETPSSLCCTEALFEIPKHRNIKPHEMYPDLPRHIFRIVGILMAIAYRRIPIRKKGRKNILGQKRWHFYLSENPPLEDITVIYEPAQVNGQLHLRCSVRQMGREYSKSTGRAWIIRSACLMWLSGPEKMIFKVCLMGGGACWRFVFPVFGNNNLLFDFFFCCC